MDNVLLESVNGWIIVLSRVNFTFPMRQNWANYRAGFGEVMYNFWLGLERIFQLVNGATNGKITYRLRFELQSNDTHE
jgi:hypothetical protein